METPEVAIQAFLAKNAEFIQAHGERLAKGIADSQSASPALRDVGLDDDLIQAFNDVAGNLIGQLVILQMQTNRRLDRLVELMTDQIKLMKEEE